MSDQLLEMVVVSVDFKVVIVENFMVVFVENFMVVLGAS